MISLSAESANETASDNPGPGRLLGKIYATLGRWLEGVLCSAARSMGRGPVPTATRIHKLSRNLDYQAPNVVTVKKLRKDCRTLVKYTRYCSYFACLCSYLIESSSRAESTRKQALDKITRLSFESKKCLTFLKSVGAAQVIKDQELYVWDYCDTSLRLSSRIALSCLSNDDAYTVARQYCGLVCGMGEDKTPLTTYMRYDHLGVSQDIVG